MCGMGDWGKTGGMPGGGGAEKPHFMRGLRPFKIALRGGGEEGCI